MKNKSVSKSFSIFVINCLKNNGMKLTNRKIANLIDEQRNFVEDILQGKENFTVGHLQKIGEFCKVPLPLMLMKEIEKKPVPAGRKSTHQNLCEVISAYQNLRVTQSSGSTSDIQTESRRIAVVDIKRKGREERRDRIHH